MDTSRTVTEEKNPTAVIKQDWFDAVDEVFANAYSDGCFTVTGFAEKLAVYVAECIQQEASGLAQAYALNYLELVDWWTLAKEIAVEHELELEGING